MTKAQAENLSTVLNDYLKAEYGTGKYRSEIRQDRWSNLLLEILVPRPQEKSADDYVHDLRNTLLAKATERGLVIAEHDLVITTYLPTH